MARMKYTEKLAARIAATRSALCVGLDPRPQTENMTEQADWLRKVVEETAPPMLRPINRISLILKPWGCLG